MKTKGIRKTLQGLHKIIRGTLHRAKIALERPQGEEEGVNPTGSYSQYHPHLGITSIQKRLRGMGSTPYFRN